MSYETVADEHPQPAIPRYSVPADFPKRVASGAVAGAQPKVLLTRYEGRFYAAGCTPPEVHSQWEYCESVAQHLAKKSIECKAGKRSHMDEAAIIEQYFERLVKTGWVSEAEAAWTMRRCAHVLKWPLPDSLGQFDGPQADGGTLQVPPT